MRRIVGVVFGCCLLASPAWAGGGLHLFGTYTEVSDNIEAAGAGGRLSVGGESLVFDITATWLPRRGGDIVSQDGVRIEDRLQVTPFDLGIRYVFSPGKQLRPYVGVGASYIVTNLNTGTVDDEVGFYGLLGLAWNRQREMGFYGELIYRDAEMTADYGFDGSYDVDLGGLGIAIGVFVGF